ncbi:hypothetical protein [Umezawaea sp. Da 62-37]|uniref:hypothetical protein n=1 Tax=Umezawaea sp. Da 62-37 TaxID=3075927 RepID=UPI0028F71985|nr:hypothetical protein [Umezawaea sp. Da 62-37]WNV90538.1 hypothetical protein RM788_20315 [Umezawaea sp. Da 62-37]
MNTEDLIRDSLMRQADLAPPPGPTLAALRKPRRRRMPLLIAVAVTAAALVAVAVVVDIRSVRSADPATTGAPSKRTTGTPATPVKPSVLPDRNQMAVDVPVLYEPQWLPDGFVEQEREFPLGHSLKRTWRNPADPTGIVMLLVDPEGKNSLFSVQHENSPDRVDLGANGDGAFGPASLDEAGMSWYSADGGSLLMVTVEAMPGMKEVARRIAESTTSGGTSVHASALVLAPEHVGAGDFVTRTWKGTSPTEWTIQVEVSHLSRSTQARLTPTSPDTAGGTSVRAREAGATFVPARQVNGDWTDVMLVVPVGDRFLTVAGKSFQPGGGGPRAASEITLETLTAIANTTVVVQNTDLSWFGTR